MKVLSITRDKAREMVGMNKLNYLREAALIKAEESI
jgi:hypothetical protein